MTLSCAIIDDEPLAVSLLESYVKKTPYLDLAGRYNSALNAVSDLTDHPVDLLFLDIQMNSISGLEIANTLPGECCFIFTTAYAEYALDGFNLDAVDFLHKPFSYERFEVAVEKAMRRINARRPSASESLVVKQEYNNVSILLDDILYIEALGNYVKIVRVSGGHVLTRTNLKSIMDLLPVGRFLRIHRSYVVAVGAVVSFTRSKVVLKGHDEGFPVGAQYASQVIEALGG